MVEKIYKTPLNEQCQHALKHSIHLQKYLFDFVRWYILQCKNQGQPCDGEAYDLPDAYADYLETLR